MKRTTVRYTVGVVLPLIICGVAYLIAGTLNHRRPIHQGFFSNNSYINGLYQNLKLRNSRDVFRHIFTDLPDEVTVYPSENYYYFRTAIRGIDIDGAFALTLDRIDSGVVGFGYRQVYPPRGRNETPPLEMISRDFGDSDGVEVTRYNDLRYAVTFEGKRVVFNFYDGGVTPPQKVRLMRDEVYVGPAFDESGMQFFLIFNNTTRKLYWVLNEDGFAPDEFRRVSDHVVMGGRTEFAFYVDSVNNRKILIGVQEANVVKNNWFDGPFDQLPDNYVRTGKIEVQKYLEAHLGLKPKVIDRYGNYLGNNFARVVIAPYTVYLNEGNLSFVDSLLALKLPPSEFYTKITASHFVKPPGAVGAK